MYRKISFFMVRQREGFLLRTTMNNRWFKVFVALLFFPLPLLAVQTGKFRPNFRHFSIEEGFPSSETYFVQQDRFPNSGILLQLKKDSRVRKPILYSKIGKATSGSVLIVELCVTMVTGSRCSPKKMYCLMMWFLRFTRTQAERCGLLLTMDCFRIGTGSVLFHTSIMITFAGICKIGLPLINH